MLTSQQEQYIRDVLRDKNVDAKDALIKGNRLGAAYLAMLAGMWANFFKRDAKANPFNDDDILLYSHWADGYDAFNQALGMSDEVRKKQLEYEKAVDAKREQESGKIKSPYEALKVAPPKKTDWNIKLW